MTNKEILQADILDILFEHRNKSYGAYSLRKGYNRRLGIASGISLSLVIILLLFSSGKKNNDNKQLHVGMIDSVVVKTFDFIPEKNMKKEKSVKQIKQTKSTNKIKIVPDNIKPDMPEQEEIANTVISTEKVNGSGLADPNIITGKADEESGPEFPEINIPEVDFVPKEIPPSFPGGLTAWLNFLRKHLQAPEGLDEGQRVEVRVKFRIDKDGKLSGFEIIQSGGNRFDKEVLRAMKKMPDWTPALQNNYRVAAAYTQPVIFLGVKE